MTAQRNAQQVRTSQSITSLRHARNLLSFLNRSLAELPDETLVEHLEEFFDYVDESIEKSIQLPLEEDIEELKTLIVDLQAGWDKLISPTTSAPYVKEPTTSSLLA